MIRISKGGKETSVTESAYKNYFARNGWTKIDTDSSDPSSDHGNDDWDEETENDDWDEEPAKPLSEMNRAELEAYAKEKDVDLTGLTSNNQIRKAIKEKLEAAGE